MTCHLSRLRDFTMASCAASFKKCFYYIQEGEPLRSVPHFVRFAAVKLQYFMAIFLQFREVTAVKPVNFGKSINFRKMQVALDGCARVMG